MSHFNRHHLLHSWFPVDYLRTQVVPHHFGRWSITPGGARVLWNQHDLMLPGSYEETHTLEGHDAYLTALLQQGASIREMVADGLRFPMIDRQAAGQEAASALRRWLQQLWTLLVDLAGHRQRLRAFSDPRDVPAGLWREHRNVWLHFRWELVVPDDEPVATMVLAHLRLYGFPHFSWMDGPRFGEVLLQVHRRVQAPVAHPRATILLEMNDRIVSLNKRAAEKVTDVVTLKRGEMPQVDLLAAGDQGSSPPSSAGQLLPGAEEHEYATIFDPLLSAAALAAQEEQDDAQLMPPPPPPSTSAGAFAGEAAALLNEASPTAQVPYDVSKMLFEEGLGLEAAKDEKEKKGAKRRKPTLTISNPFSGLLTKQPKECKPTAEAIEMTTFRGPHEELGDRGGHLVGKNH